jgi:hypothetical protein
MGVCKDPQRFDHQVICSASIKYNVRLKGGRQSRIHVRQALRSRNRISHKSSRRP